MASDELSYCQGYEQVIRKGLALSNFEAYAYAYAYASKIHIGQVKATHGRASHWVTQEDTHSLGSAEGRREGIRANSFGSEPSS